LTEIPAQNLNAGANERAARSRVTYEPSVSREDCGSLRRGARVHHQKFGEGKVLDTSGTGPDRRVTVLFHKAGRKRLVAHYAKLEVIS
jgi:DNA helicase-2/ATP-dependent DNA helicase PcrA